MKICTRCGEEKPIDSYLKDKRTKDGLGYWCSSCRTEYRKEHKKKEWYKKSQRKYKLKSRYGISLEEFREKHENQAGKCAICGNPQVIHGRRSTTLCVDHSHITGKVRDLVCYNCNLIIGNSFENIEILEKAIQYLKRYTNE